MSINHFSSDFKRTGLLWNQQHHQHLIMQNHFSSDKPHLNFSPPPPIPVFPSPMPLPTFNLNHLDHDDEPEVFNQTTAHDGDKRFDEMEVMFEKPLTPSDVGKLNRLVIPKQYAEKYFPLGGSGDSGGGDKGLLLSFEDESGKLWRFRYSYWNSSQSYVLTKGWSRYVKEKRLDAGDVVVFQRHRLDGDRLFIGWKRRSPTVAVQDSNSVARGNSSGGGWTRMFYSAHPYPAHHHHPYQSDCHHAAAESSVKSQTVTVGNSKILRLFGVNLECQTDEFETEPAAPSTPGAGSSLTSQDPMTYHHFYPHYYSSSLPDHMDFAFSQDIKQTKNHQG